MRQDWFPFTFGKDDVEQIPTKPENIQVKGPKCVFQKTFSHNFGKSGAKNHKLTATSYRSGTSSCVAQVIHSDHHQRHFDLIAVNPKDLKDYQMVMSDSCRFMRGFSLLCGEDIEEELRKSDDENHMEFQTHNELLRDRVTPLTESQGDCG